MKQTIALKLETTPEQFYALLETVEAFNAGCGYVAEAAFAKHSANKIAIQPFVYAELRSRFGLSSQMAVRAIGKACEAYKRDKNIKPTFTPHGAMIYDERIMNIRDAAHVSLLTLTGRVIVGMRYGSYQAARLAMQKGQADLVLRGGVFYLYVCIDLATPPPVETSGYLGVDLGIVEIASDSAGNQYSGQTVKRVRKNVREHRRQLQRKQTNSAKKRLRKMARKQSRFVRDTNHCISKKIVATALHLKKALSLENLCGVRERESTVSKQMRWLLGNWSFSQLAQFVSYKAEAAGLRVVFVDPRNTSRICSACGYCDKANRLSQSCFHCLECGFHANADLNAARNIEARAEQSDRLLSFSLVWTFTVARLCPITICAKNLQCSWVVIFLCPMVQSASADTDFAPMNVSVIIYMVKREKFYMFFATASTHGLTVAIDSHSFQSKFIDIFFRCLMLPITATFARCVNVAAMCVATRFTF